MNSNDVVTSFESFSKSFSKTRKSPWKEFNLLAPYIKNAKHILDLGCGNGRLLPYIREINPTATYTGLDISPSLIQECKLTYPQETFMVGDMTIIPVDSVQFDLIIAMASLHHIDSAKKRKQTIKEVDRMLKPGGHFVGTVWNLHQPKYWKHWWNKKGKLQDVYIPWNDPKAPRKVHRYYRAFNGRSLKRLLKSTFISPEVRYVNGDENSTILKARNIFFSIHKPS